MKKALIMNTGYKDIGQIRALKKLGYYVIAVGGFPGQAGEPLVDEYICHDYSDRDGVLAIARENEIDAVCACSNDYGVVTAAYVAEQLGLPGHDTYENALMLFHKDRFKAFAKQYGIKSPIAEVFDSIAAAYEFLAKKSAFPVMVKAVDLCAGAGVKKVCSVTDAMPALKEAFDKSRVKHVVIEPYIEGTQHAICTFLVNQKVRAYTSNDEFEIVNPHRVEIDTFPATAIGEYKDALINEIERMAKILHLNDGIFHMQYRVAPNGEFWIMEAMRRVPGNLYDILASRMNGFDWSFWEAYAHCGLDCSVFPCDAEPSGYYAYRALAPSRNGTYRGYKISPDIEACLFDTLILNEPGYIIEDYIHDFMGLLLFEFPDFSSMHSMMIERYDDVEICVEE